MSSQSLHQDSKDLSNTHPRIPSLDGLRAISILLVIFAHGSETLPTSWKGPISHYFFPLFNASLGVRIFFVISGFLITSLLLKELRKTNSINLKNFYIKRAFRIFPAFYFYLGFIVILCLLGILDIYSGRLLSASLFLINYCHLWLADNSSGYWFVGHFWTLCLEFQFYLLFPFVLLKGEKKARLITFLLIIIIPVLRIASYFFIPSQRPYNNIMLHTAIDPIIIGAMLAMMMGRLQFEKWVHKFVNLVTFLSATVFVFILSPLIEMKMKGLYLNTVGITLTSLSIIIILLWLIRNPLSSIGKFMNSSIMVYLGQRSYSLYLWQQVFQTPSLNLTFTGKFPINFVCCFIMAELSYRFIEQTFIKIRPQLVKTS